MDKIKSFKIKGKTAQIVVGIHGITGDKESSVLDALGKDLAKENVKLLCFDLPCHGEKASSERLSLSSCIKETEKIIKYAQSFNVPISLFATSFGGYIALTILAKEKFNFKNVILRCPAVFMDEILANLILPTNNKNIKDLDRPVDIGYEFPLFVDKNFYAELCNNKLENKNFNQTINVIQGKKDDIVDWQKNEEFFIKKFGKRCTFHYIPSADHRFKKPGELEKIVEISEKIIFGK